MKDYITEKERMNNLIVKRRKWKWLGPKYNMNNKKVRSSNELFSEIHGKENTGLSKGNKS